MAARFDIILVDDDRQIRALAVHLLRNDFPDARIIEVLDADTLHRALDAAPPGLVITDYQLGWTNGLHIFRLVKARWPECPVIMFTGTGSEEIAVAAMKAGLDDYVLKSPQHAIRLSAAVHAVLKQSEQRRSLRETEHRCRLLLESITEGVYGIDLDGRCTFINRAGAAMLGYIPDELVGRSLHELTHPTSPDGTPCPAEACPVLLASRTGSDRLVKDDVFWRRDGTSFAVEYTCAAVREEGRISGAVVTFTDISRRAQLTRQAGRTERLAALGQLLGGIAHELKNPLFVLTGHLQLLQEKVAHGEYDALPGDLEKMSRAAKRAMQITERFLSMARPAQPKRERCSVTDLLRQTLEFLGNELMKNQITAVTDLAPNLPDLHCEPRQLHDVFLNLILNAMQAMAGTHGKGTLTIKAELSAVNSQPSAPEQSWIEVRIQDDGPGIAPEHREKLFEPFFTTKPPDQGTGLGLWMARSAVTGLGGTIDCESEAGRGTTFIIRLPTGGDIHSLPARSE